VTDQERIARLEAMVKTLTETVQRVISVVNTGSYEYSLHDIDIALTDTPEFKYEPEPPKEEEVVLRPTPNLDQLIAAHMARRPKCPGLWHEYPDTAPWCDVCGRSR